MPSGFDQLHASALRGVAKNKKRARALVADIRKRSTRMAEDAHAVGKALEELSEERVYSALGYDSFAKLLDGEKLMGRTTAHRLMSIAQTYSAEQVKALGVRKAYALLSYADATPKLDHAALLYSTNARIGNKRVESMTIRDINEAAKRVRDSSGRPKPRSGPEKLARTAARKLQARLRKSGIKLAKVNIVRREGKLRLQVELDVSDAGKLG